MTEREFDRDNFEPGLTQGDVHSGPGGYEGMGYQDGYAAEHFGKDDDEDESEEESDFEEDEANR